MNKMTDYSDHILLVDDEAQTLLGFGTLLKSSGLPHVITIEDSREVKPFLEQHTAALVVLDLAMPFVSGQQLLTWIKEKHPQIPVIVMTATNDIDTAVACMQNGALDYLVKPVEKSRFVSSVRRALEIRSLTKEVSSLKKHILSDKLENPQTFSQIITNNKRMFAIFKYIEAISPSPHPVLITGETGVGKELLASTLHFCAKHKGEFVAVNVAGLDDAMFSDTLFGHKKGAFTGADSSREGLIACAASGTIFLDEIGDLNQQSQVKLMRLIQEKEYYTLGSDIPKKTDAHVITATNRDLHRLMKEEKFRRDLYFRLNAHHIHIPPLRERKEDIPALVNHFLQKAAAALNKNAPTPPPQLNALLASYDFPGNVRELESMVYDAVSRHRSGILSMESFKEKIHSENQTVEETGALSSTAGHEPEQIFGRFPTLKEMEDYLLDEALKRSGANQGIAASLLGITRQALNKRLSRRKE